MDGLTNLRRRGCASCMLCVPYVHAGRTSGRKTVADVSFVTQGQGTPDRQVLHISDAPLARAVRRGG